MSKTFMSTTTSRALTAYSAGGGLTVAVADKVITLANADAPALALAILEAAGVEPLAQPDAMPGTPGHARDIAHSLRGYIRQRDEAIKEAADREVLEKRRNELAIEFGSSPLGYNDTFESTQRAIDRVIELEDKAKS